MNMSSTEVQEEDFAKTEEKMEASTSIDGKANTGTAYQDLSPNTTTKDITDSDLDTKAGGDIKMYVDPSAIITVSSETELVLDTKSDNIDDEGNSCKEKVSDSGDSIPLTSITSSGPMNDIYDGPDLNLSTKTINLLTLPHSATGRSTPATDSSEMMEEDMVLKWDDEDEETEKLEEFKNIEEDKNPSLDFVDKEITNIVKVFKPKKSDLEIKIDDSDIDMSAKNISPTEIKKTEKSSKHKHDCVVVVQENKENPQNAPTKNLVTNHEKKFDAESMIKQNVSPIHSVIMDQNQMNMSNSTNVAVTIEQPFGVAVNFQNEEIEGSCHINVKKDTASIENIISNLDEVLGSKKENPKIKDNHESCLNRKTDQTQIIKSLLSDSSEIELTTEKLNPDSEIIDNTEDTQMDVDKVITSISNKMNLDQIIDSDVKDNENETIKNQKIDPSLDAKTNIEQVDFTDSSIVKSNSEKSYMDTEIESSSEKKIDTQMDTDKVTTCVDSTNHSKIISDNGRKPINKENLDLSVQINIDLKQLNNKMDTPRSIETVTEKKVEDTTNTKTNEKSVDLGASSKVPEIVSPIEKKQRSIKETSNIDSHDSMIDGVIMKGTSADIIFPAKSISLSGNSSEIDMSTSDSFLDATLEEKEHNLIKPNMMTEIPSQNMIGFDESISLTHDESVGVKNQDDSIDNSNEQSGAIDGESQRKIDLLEERSIKSDTSKSEIKDSKIHDLDENAAKHTKQTTSENESELSKGIKKIDSDKTETEVTKLIDSEQMSAINKDDSSLETQDETKPVFDPLISSKTTDQTLDQAPQEVQPANLIEPKVSSTQMDPDTSDEVPDVTDSLGLLAESSRVMEDDEEQETSDHDEVDDEEDFDQDDESSNQMTTEQDSNDSNTAQLSETDAPKEVPLTQADVQTELDIEPDNVQDFTGKLEDTDDLAEMETEDFQSESNIETEVADKEGDVDIEEDMVIDEVDIAATTVDRAALQNQALNELASALMEAAEELEKNDAVDAPVKQDISDIETVKLSDTSDAEEDAPKMPSTSILKTSIPPSIGPEDETPILKTLLTSAKDTPGTTAETSSPSKTKKLEISKPKPALNFVDLEESSSEDEPPADVQEVPKEPGDDVTTVNIPSEIEIMAVGENTSDIVTNAKEVVICGLPKPPAVKVARLNTSEVTIKTTTTNEPTPSLVIPEVKGDKDKSKYGLEVFNLDSDEEEPPAKVVTPPPAPAPSPPPAPQPPKPPEKRHKCINDACPSDGAAPRHAAPRAARAMFAPNHNKRAQICERCAQAVIDRSEKLVSGMRSLGPLLQLDMGGHRQELVEISDSDSEGEGEGEEEEKVTIGWKGAAMLDSLTEMINESWEKFQMDERLKQAEEILHLEQSFQEKELKELGAILDECQVATDKLRNELYATFEPKKKELPALVVFDTPDNMYSFVMPPQTDSEIEKTISGQYKRRLSSVTDAPSKKVAIPLGFTPANEAKSNAALSGLRSIAPKPADSAPVAGAQDHKNDDDKDISVVQLSAEAAPASLPPPGEPSRPKVHAGMQVYAMRNAFGSWLKGKVVECTHKGSAPSAAQFSQCRVKFESKTHKNAFKTLPARCLAYSEPSEVRMTIGTRIIALFKEKDKEMPKRESYYSGIVAEVPNPVNNFRYLVFFDDGYAQYVQHADTRLVCEFSSLVWEEVHPFSREFVRQYLLAYPERPMVRLHTGQSLKTEWNGKWWSCKVVQVDASLVHVHFEKDNRTEWIYRGSTRLAPLYLELQAAERHRARPLPRNRLANQSNMPYVEYTRSEEQTSPDKPTQNIHSQIQAQEDLRRQRAVAKKSTTSMQTPAPAPQPQPQPPQAPPHAAPAETVTSRVVYYTPKNAVKPYKMTAHTCSPKCKRSDVLSLKELRTYNPLAKPLLSGWERQIVRFKGHKEVMYRAPCGRRVRDMRELHRYLRTTRSEMSVDLFDFATTTHCLAEFVLNRCIVSKKDLSNGKENVPVPCVNYYDDSLPEFCSYNTERTPTEGVPLNIDPEFLCGCDCTDDCEDKSKCACWQLTLEGARTIGLDGDVGYEYRRLPEPLPSGIYECNSKCKCKQTCLNRVAQHPLQLKLQVFKTINRGWGIRALNDVPKGAFLCVYAGNLLTDATANLDGLNEGDEYLAELDYIEVVEQMKEGYEEDIPEADKKLDKKESGQSSSSEQSSSEEEEQSRSEQTDGDFEPGYIGLGLQDFSKRLRKRDRSKKKSAAAPPAEKNKDGATEEECITISDDEELREPSRFAAQPGMGAEFVSKYRSVRSYFGKDEACYIMDAKVQGNIGRYLNHSCTPNVFVQNVFVDTHDPRFPWVAFFALRPVRAGTELTWNYNYDVGSVPGKVLYCYCGAANCRGRLL